MRIGGSDVVGKPHWEYYENYGQDAFEAGWMPESEAMEFIKREALRWITLSNNC